MEAKSNRRPRSPLEQKFSQVGTFERLADGTIVPELPQQASKEEEPQVKL